MDYDDLVDQFIVNDNDNETTSTSSEAQENKPETTKSENSEFNPELIKLHMKNLIQSRQQSRQIIQLNRVKERNKNFAEVFKTSGNNVSGGYSYSFGNSEKRRKILRDEGSNEVQSEGNEADNTINEQDSTTTTTSTTASTELIPCRLELDYEGYKLSDVFLLPSTPPPTQKILDSIANQLCQDFDLPADLFRPAIAKCLKDQVEEWHVYQGALEGMKVIPYEEIGAVPVRLDVIVGLHRLEDRLEVSLDPKDSNTETMREFVKNLKSPDERVLPESGYAAFRPLILHNLLEQLMLWRKAIVFGGYHRDPRSNNLKFHDGDVAVLLNDPPSNKNSGNNGVRRHFADTNSFTPILSLLTVEELDKIEAGRERESRRRRRTIVTTATNTNNSKKAGNAAAIIVNNLTGTVRSPPRTLPTPTSYRGSQHRIQQTATGSDDESTAPRKRGRKSKQ